MRTVIQRVSEASVTISGNKKSEIQRGVLIFLGIEDADNEEDTKWLVNKIVNLRIFNDDKGIMNISLRDVGGEAIVVSQFTLHASTKKGNRPSYIKAAKPPIAVPLYKLFISEMERLLNKNVGAGEFGADMKVALINDGPVTIMIDSKRRD